MKNSQGKMRATFFFAYFDYSTKCTFVLQSFYDKKAEFLHRHFLFDCSSDLKLFGVERYAYDRFSFAEKQ